ncbi:MAG: hypothetical protein IKF24_03160 [Eubacterium sp.]|nr:hypothetical protein [Eubacterium sp.]MBR3173513.1 hypothetical protein [Eubacterium sp.]
MLNNEKITLMTKLSLYEEKHFKDEITTSKLFKSDYLSSKMLGSFACVTIGYILIMVLLFSYLPEVMFGLMTTTTSFIIMMIAMILIYIIVVVLYMIYSYAFYSHKFKEIRGHLKEYNGDLKTLHRIQEQEYDAIIDELEEEMEND